MENELCIRLYRNNEIEARCKANFIGLMGIHINIFSLMYSKGTHLEVDISVDNQSGISQCRLPAVVTSRSNNGVGLTFVNSNIHILSTLKDIILYAYESEDISEELLRHKPIYTALDNHVSFD